MLVELLKPLGPELSRRWLATLLAVPGSEREKVVAAIEARVAQAYAGRIPESAGKATAKRGRQRGKSLDVVQPPVQREGYTEQIVTTYDEVEEPQAPAVRRKRRSAGA